MYLLVNDDKKVIFYFSRKCASIHVMNLFNYLSNRLENCIQTTSQPFSPYALYQMEVQQVFPENVNDYKIIIFIRNPYKRLVSSFRFLYDPIVGLCVKRRRNIAWLNDRKRTFRNFVEERCALGKYCKPKIIEFLSKPDDCMKTLQVCECRVNCPYTLQQIEPPLLEIKNIHKIFDIEHIDYKYLESLFGKVIPDDIKNYKGPYVNSNPDPINVNVCDLDMSEYIGKLPTIAQYYDRDIFNKVTDFYRSDLDYFAEHGF